MTQAGLYALLVGNSELNTQTDLGQIIGGRLTPVLLPEDSVLPAMTYKLIYGRGQQTLKTSGAQKVRVEFNAYASAVTGTYDQAAQAREALRCLLNQFSGTLSDGTILNNVELVNSGTDFFENDTRQFRCMSEFYLYFNFPSS
jgi:hypothetical protein